MQQEHVPDFSRPVALPFRYHSYIYFHTYVCIMFIRILHLRAYDKVIMDLHSETKGSGSKS